MNMPNRASRHQSRRGSACEDTVRCEGVTGWLVEDPGAASVVERVVVPDNMATTNSATETRDLMKRSLATPIPRVL